MPIPDIPPHLQERIVCSITAAIKYEVPANILLAVASKEAGKPGQWVKNTNGTHDVGPLQFNTTYLHELRKYGITADDVAQGGCYSYDLAAWRLRGHLRNDSGDIWTRAANYHSRTPQHNAPYRADLVKRAGEWQRWIEARFETFDATRSAVQIDQSPVPQAQVSRSSDALDSLQHNPAAARALAAVFGSRR